MKGSCRHNNADAYSHAYSAACSRIYSHVLLPHRCHIASTVSQTMVQYAFIAMAAMPHLFNMLNRPPPPPQFMPVLHNGNDTSRNGTALFVTAHPDDEAMFFAPSILGLQTLGWDVAGLCLSSGKLQPVRSDIRQRLWPRKHPQSRALRVVRQARCTGIARAARQRPVSILSTSLTAANCKTRSTTKPSAGTLKSSPTLFKTTLNRTLLIS